MRHVLELSETFNMKGRTVAVTEAAFEHLLPARAFLIGIARCRSTVTYGEFIEKVELPYRPQGIGRFLDLISQDCIRRGEPTLAALVVGSETGEVGDDFDGDPGHARQLLYRRWA